MTIVRRRVVATAMTVSMLCATGGGAVAHADAPNRPGKGTTYCAEMPDSVGLYVGNPVTQMGFEVGTVDSIVERGDRVEVTFATSVDRAFPADVQAVTRSKSILADRSLELVGNLTSGPALEPGTCIPLQHSHTPRTISEIVGSAADFLGELSPEGSKATVAGAVAGLAEALRGEGDNARELVENAAAAMEDPDRTVADLGTAVSAMAPLTEQTLADWGAITSLATQLPDIATAGIDLFPGTIDVCVGIGWLVATLYDVQTRYGGEIWPFVHGPVTQAVALAAGRAGDLSGLVAAVPSLAAVLRQQSSDPGGLVVRFTPPSVTLGDGTAIDLANLLGDVLTKGPHL
ncbi:MlaD family protein [Prescottella equi]|uniref:MlaD family protein n=1 Tax=Rhodococcus hoagii TaxID=43767 RepID=UPI000A10AB67|nr:MlaD family protein [Prescottella equi]ORL16016.1 mammalian cell entry protein [Prescottella equi]